MDEPIIRIENLHFSYNSESPNPIVALRGIDLEIKRGEYIVIVGHNGAGKSTLAKNLNALLTPTEGDVWVNGVNTKDEEHALEIRSAVGMVFQNPDNQIVGTIVEEDVAFGPENLGVPSNEIEERVRWSLELVEMLPYRNRAPHLLSAGQKQRVAIASVLAMRPEVIVLDESTSMLDPVGRREVLEAVRRLNEEGVTIVAITHSMSEAVEADRVLVMERGKIVMEGTPKEVFGRVDELRKMQLDIPQITELAHSIHQHLPDFPPDILTVEEMVDEILRLSPLSSLGPRSDIRSELVTFSPSSKAIVEVNDLNHTYMRGTPLEAVALRGTNLEVHEGETVGIIGRTGSGKSTLVQHLNGLIRPRERGKVLVDGCDLADLSIDIKALRRKVGLIFQNPERQLFKRLVKEDISFGPRRMGLSEEEIKERVKWAMDMVGLNFDDFKDRFTFSLSGGEMRRVAIAGILALRPKVLILDESTSGLDPKGRKDFLSRIKSFKREGMTIIFISPNMEDVAEIVDKVYVMEEGRMVMSGTPEDVFSKPEELRRYGLGVPQVAEVMHELMERGIEVSAIPLTIAEAEEEILRILKPASFD